MTGGQVGSWQAAFDDLDLLPPFPQLDREAFTPSEAEADGTTFVRPGVLVPAAKLRGTLEGRGWGHVMIDHGFICGFVKRYPAADVTAGVRIQPAMPIVRAALETENLRVEGVHFYGGAEQAGHAGADLTYETPSRRMRLSDVDPVAFSETARDLQSLAPSGKG
jgi:hypothetical protein